MLTLTAVLLSSTIDVANGLRNLAQMHQVVEVLELRRAAAFDVPANLPADPWGTPYRIEGTRVVSAGSDRKFEENPPAGQFAGTEGDVVFENGSLVRTNRNWLYARVVPDTDSEAALDELRRAEMMFMISRAPRMRDLLLVKLTVDAMQRGDTKVDAWGTPLRTEGARVISAGADKQFDPMSWDRPAANDLNEDIIVENGAVVRLLDPEAFLRAKPPAIEVIPQPVDTQIPAPAAKSYIRMGTGVVAPKVLKRVEPRYPEDYRMARISGIVIVEAMISEEGVVKDVRLLKSRGPELDAAAMDAVKQWTFEPATMDGKPVPVIFNLTINFKLN